MSRVTSFPSKDLSVTTFLIKTFVEAACLTQVLNSATVFFYIAVFSNFLYFRQLGPSVKDALPEVGGLGS